MNTYLENHGRSDEDIGKEKQTEEREQRQQRGSQ